MGKVVRMTQPVPDTAGQPPRALTIAAIHAYAEWLAANPDVPVPDGIDGHCYQHGVAPEASVAAAAAVSDAHNGKRHVNGSSKWITVDVMAQPVKIQHTIFCNHDRTADKW